MSLLYKYALLAHLNYYAYGCDLHICRKYKDCEKVLTKSVLNPKKYETKITARVLKQDPNR